MKAGVNLKRALLSIGDTLTTIVARGRDTDHPPNADKPNKIKLDWISDVRAEFVRSGSIQAAFRAKLDAGEYSPVSHESDWPYPLAPRYVPKTIWMYWSQGWENAPEIVKQCRYSWVLMNPGWDVVALDADLVSGYVDMSDLLAGKDIGHAAYSDVLRLHLLHKFGGVWVDATTVCAKPLDHWLPPLMQSGFFAFARPRPDRLVATWFLASEPSGLVSGLWLDLVRRYWREVERADHYFWCHYLFAYGFSHDSVFAAGWAVTPQISAYACMQAQPMSRPTQPEDEVIAGLKGGRVPVYKLNHHLSVPAAGDGTPLAAVLASIMGG